MSHNVLIAPSILSADFTRLGEELSSVASADYIHFDVMDGHFVPNFSFGAAILPQVKAATKLPIDVHLMVSNPDEVVESYLNAGADVVTFHEEAAIHAQRIIDCIHAHGAKAGVAINPGTSIYTLDSLVGSADLILVMSVNPGYGGQSFIESVYDKIERLCALCAERGANPIIEVDGGVSAKNAARLADCGVTMFVAGSAVFHADDRAAAIASLRV